MDALLKRIGYSSQLDEKIKFTYIIAGIGFVQLSFFILLYLVISPVAGLILESLFFLFTYVIEFVLLKRQFYRTAKLLPILAMCAQVTFLVHVWFPHETYFFLYFFLVPPCAFFLLDLEDRMEKNLLIAVNALAAVLILVFGFVPPVELIALKPESIAFFRILSIVSTLLTEILVFYFYASSLARTHRELKILANTDALTRIANRRVLFEQGELLVSVSTKYQRPFTLMILDVDHFKQINDRYGHPAGDEVLVELSNLISVNIRREDLVCRYGGEEFAVMFRNMDKDHRHTIGHMMEKLNQHTFTVNRETKIRLTVSAGVVTCQGNETHFKDIVKRADALLYEAKQTGRNKVVFD